MLDISAGNLVGEGMAKPVASRGADQFMVRMPDGMREQISRVAEQSGRSMNSEIVARLSLTLA